MKREQLSQFLKQNLSYVKEAVCSFPETVREAGAEGVLKVTLASVLMAAMTIMYACGFNNALNKKEQKEQQQVVINGVRVPAKYAGQFSISHYCSCPLCTNTPKGSRTATGHIPREGRTVAVDKNIIPLHSVIYVEGLGTFVAEDVGGAVKGNHLDIYIDDHQRALNLGTLRGVTPKVYILN